MNVDKSMIEQMSYQPPSDSETETNEFVIEMSSIEQMTTEAAKECFKVIVSNFEDAEILKTLDDVYLPSMDNQHFQKMDRMRLCYLTLFKPGDSKSPFIKEQIEVFQTSHRDARANLGWLKYAIIPFSVVSSSSFIGLVAATGLSTAKSAAIAGSVGMLSSVTLNMLSLYITGINPTRSKDADNAKQSMVQSAKGIYDELAKELMELNESNPKIAKGLANQINIQLLKEAGERDYLDKNDLEDIFDLFQDAIFYIRKDREYPRSHDLRRYVLSYSPI